MRLQIATPNQATSQTMVRLLLLNIVLAVALMVSVWALVHPSASQAGFLDSLSRLEL
jgi:hypothetical protein